MLRRTNTWLAALQVPMFVAVVSPTLVGLAVAFREGHALDPPRLGLVFLALVLIQAATNLQKGYFEGKDMPTGAARPVPSLFAFDVTAVGRLKSDPRRIYHLSLGLLAAAALLGTYLDTLVPGHVVLVLGVVGAFLGYTYSGPPLRMSYRGLGEVNTFVAFGPLAVVGVHYALVGRFSWTALAASIPLGFLTASISLVRYFLTLEEDRAKGKRDPVVRFGRSLGTGLVGMMLAAGAAAVVPFIALGLLPLATLALVAAVAPWIPLVLSSVRAPERAKNLRAVKAVVTIDLLSGIVLALALLP